MRTLTIPLHNKGADREHVIREMGCVGIGYSGHRFVDGNVVFNVAFRGYAKTNPEWAIDQLQRRIGRQVTAAHPSNR